MTRLLVCAVLSLVAHLAITEMLELLPEREPPHLPRVISFHVVAPPAPAAVPVPVPVPAPAVVEAPHADVHAAPTPARTPAARPPAHVASKIETAATTAPPAEHAVVAPKVETDQVFHGGDLSSVSQAGGPPGSTGSGSGPGGGDGSGGAGGGGAAHGKPAGGDGPIAQYAATRMPLPQGSCTAKYTPEATTAATEGIVVLDLTVGADGRTRDIVATTQLPNGLTAAAIAALRACRFSPGEKDGQPVAVRIRGFKVQFVLNGAAP